MRLSSWVVLGMACMVLGAAVAYMGRFGATDAALAPVFFIFVGLSLVVGGGLVLGTHA